MAGQLPDFSAGNKLVADGSAAPAAGAPLPDFSAGNKLADAPSATTTSPLAALRNSAGSIVSGLGNMGNTIDQGIQQNAPAWLSKVLGATGDLQNGDNQAVIAAGRQLSGPQQYDGQSVHRFMTDAGNGNLGGAAYDALGAVASAAPYAATAMIPGAGVAALGASGAGNTMAARMQAQGETSPSLGDVAAGAGAAALNMGLGPASAGVMRFVGPTAGNIASRALLRTALAGGAGAATGAGNYALDTAGTGNMTGAGALNAAEEGAGTGVTAGAATAPLAAARSVIGTARTNAAVGPSIRAFAAESSPWNSAFQQAVAGVQAKNPNLSPDDANQVAAMQVQAQGIKPPTYDNLSPAAQRGLAQLGVLQMYQQRAQLASTGQGKDAADINPSTTFKDVLGDITRNLAQTSSLLKQSGQITPDQASDLNAAISEAKQGNRNPAQGGADAGYFDTLSDKVAALPIDPAYRNTISMMLRMADEAEDNSWKQASMGPLERNSGKIMGLAGLVGAPLFASHFGIGGGFEAEAAEGLGGLMGTLRSGLGRTVLRATDKVMGLQLPPILKNQSAIEGYAAQNGLTNPVTPGDVMAMNQNLAASVPSPEQQMMDQAALRNQQVLNAAGLTPNTQNQGTSLRAENAAVMQMQRRAQAIRAFTNPQTGAPQMPPARQPMSMLSRQGPAPAPAQAAPAAPPAPAGPAQQMATMNAALQGQSSTNDAAIRGAFPVAGTTWQRAIANNTGIPVQAIQDHIQGLADSGALPKAVHQQISMQDQLPIGQYGRLNDYFANMAQGQGVTPPGPQAVPQGPLGAGVDPNAAIRLAKYRAAVQTAHNVHGNIVAQNPDLAPIANLLAGVKTAEDRGTALDHYIAGLSDPAAQARAEAVLRPLTVFGWKPTSGSPDPRTSSQDTE